MMEEIAKIEILDHDIIELNPAIDYHDAIAYVGVYLPCKLYDKKGKPTNSFEHFMITSDRKTIHVRTELPDNFILRSMPIRKKGAIPWTRDDITKWFSDNNKVGLYDVYCKIRGKLQHYMEFGDARIYDVITTWLIGTYFYHLFPSYPYLAFVGLKRSGKSKLMHILKLISHNGILTSSLTTASAYRTAEGLRATILADEHEFLSTRNKLSERQQELRTMFLEGYKQGSEAYKTEGEGTKSVNAYSPYSPKAVANIAGVEDVLEDRCLPIKMYRAVGDQRNREIDILDVQWQEIRNQLHRAYLENAGSVVSVVSAVSVVVPERIVSRERELWKPLFIIADLIGNGIRENIEAFALDSIGIRTESEETTPELKLVNALIDMREIRKKDEWVTIPEIMTTFKMQFEQDDKTDWITAKLLGRYLSRIHTWKLNQNKRRLGKGMEYLIDDILVNELGQRYKDQHLTTTTLTTLTTQTTPEEDNKGV